MSSSIAINEPSIFISHVFPNKAELVYDTFAELFGDDHIDDVDVVKHDINGQDICRVYVHFKKWPTTPKFQSLRNRLLNGETAKIVYEEPWYWKCVASKLPRISSKGSMTSPPKKRIVLDDKPVEPVRVKAVRPTTVPSPVKVAPVIASNSDASWADKVKTEVSPDDAVCDAEVASVMSSPPVTTSPVSNTNMTAVIDPSAMNALQYEYCCYKNGLNLKTKENFLDYLGGVIFPIVEKISPVFCSKITGMLLEIDIDALVRSLEDKTMFDTLVVRCYVTLQETIVAEMSSLMS